MDIKYLIGFICGWIITLNSFREFDAFPGKTFIGVFVGAAAFVIFIILVKILH